MKRIFLTLLAAAAIALTGCIRKTEPTDGAFIVYGKIYTAEIDPAKAPDEDGRYKMGEAMVNADILDEDGNVLRDHIAGG